MYKIEGPEDGGDTSKGPNFLLVVILFAGTILLCLALAFLFIPGASRLIHPSRWSPHPTSQMLPDATPSRLA